MIFQSVEMGRPQPAIGLEPVIELGQRLWPDAVEPTLRVGTYLDQASPLQHPEVLGHRGLAEAKPVYQLPHGQLSITKNAQDCLPVRLAENLKCRQRGHLG
jgi:hypothetical protein